MADKPGHESQEEVRCSQTEETLVRVGGLCRPVFFGSQKRTPVWPRGVSRLSHRRGRKQSNISPFAYVEEEAREELSQIAFPILVLQEGDRTDSLREERLDLPCWTMILAICALVDVSKYLDILTLEFL